MSRQVFAVQGQVIAESFVTPSVAATCKEKEEPADMAR